MTTLSQQQNKTDKAGLYIGVPCSGCGSELELGDDLFVVICPYCGSHQRLLMPDLPTAYLVQPKADRREMRFSVDRYLKEQGLPLTGPDIRYELFYYPYWKIDGVVLRIRNKIEQHSSSASQLASGYEGGESESEYETRKTEVSLAPHSVTVPAGPQLPDVPKTIGIRSHYIPMIPYDRERLAEDFVSVAASLPQQEATERVAGTVDHLGKAFPGDFGQNRSELLSCTGSIVYFPYARMTGEGSRTYQALVDCVSARVHHFAADYDIAPAAGWPVEDSIEFGALSIAPHRCSNCGEDLPRGRSFLYLCNNCHHLNLIDNSPIPIQRIDVTVGQPKDHPLFPFWVFDLSPGDAEDVTRLFGGIRQVKQLTVPAFKLRSFEALFRLTQRVSAALPSFPSAQAGMHDFQFRPVTLSPTDAIMMGRVMMYRAMVGRSPETTISQVSFNPIAAKLMYLPFHEQSYFYVDSIHDAVTFEKNLV